MNLQLLSYVLRYLERGYVKNLSLFIVLTLLTTLLAAAFFITDSMRFELQKIVDETPDIIVQKTRGGMRTTLDESLVNEMLEIPGIASAKGRIWGYYYFQKADVYFSLVGVDIYEQEHRNAIISLLQKSELEVGTMYVGEGVKRVLAENYYEDYFNFITPNLEKKRVYIAGVFTSATNLESNEMIVMQKEQLREIFGFQENEVTDIVIDVANPSELPTIALKLTQNYPNFNIVTKEDVSLSYAALFNYKNGIFLALFIIAFFTYFIIVYEKLSGLSSADKREIAILKALGWRVEDILHAKLYEALIISFGAYILGIFIAFGYVYIADAPLLKEVFLGHSGLKPEFELLLVFDMQTLFMLFIFIVPVYVLATLIPAWRIAITEVEEVMR